MFDSPSFWVAFAGLFAGTIEVSLLGRAIRILASLLGISLGEVKPKRRLWAVPSSVLGTRSCCVVGIFCPRWTRSSLLGLVCGHIHRCDSIILGTWPYSSLQSEKKAVTCGKRLTLVGADRRVPSLKVAQGRGLG
jgi:hypothetical protein